MKSPSTSIRNTRRHNAPQNGGFTLIEVLVVMGIFTLVAAIGLVFSFDSYRNYLFRGEANTVENMFFQARNRAINNFNESDHTLEILATEYRIYPESDPSDYDDFPRNDAISITPTTGTYTFEQLSGDSVTCPSGCTITITNGLLDRTITINAAGGITVN